MAKKTIAIPTGLAVARADNKYTVSWKKGDTYDAQNVRYKLDDGKWTDISGVTNESTSATLTINNDSYYPTTNKVLNTIRFAVRGKKNGVWSGWGWANWNTWVPNKAFVGIEPDSELSNVCQYDWNFEVSTEDHRVFKDAYWEAILVSDCDETDGEKLNWSDANADKRTGTTSSNDSSTTITEDTSVIANGSHTRWFRMKTRGIRGDQAWNYTKRVYAKPFKAKVNSASASVDGATINCHISWVAQTTPSHPIDMTAVQWGKCVPVANLNPSNDISWADANVSADTSNSDSASFTIDGTLDENECLYLRVNTSWEGATTYGDAVLVLKGVLSEPSGVSVNVNTHTITATNEASDIPDSFMAVIYRCGGNSFTIGVIPHGRTSVTVQPPSADAGKPAAYGVYAVVGSYTTTTRADGVTSYAVKADMRSSEVWQGGSVPVAPQNVTLESTSTIGTVMVTWKWSWSDATQAVLSWADHEDAWESTDGPDEYTVTNPHASHWNIGGLATGKRWYVKVRLDNVTEEATTEGPWSEVATIDLSSAPAVPTLAVSKAYTTIDGNVSLFWSFVSTDGTGQANAEICADTESNIIARTTTAQQVSFKPSAKGWQPNESHALRLKVWSESKKESSWSDPVYVKVVPKLSASITNTSLVNATTAQKNLLGASKVLTALPLTVTYTGAGSAGKAVVTVTRTNDYHMARPNGRDFDGFEGESIAVVRRDGNGTATITKDDLIGSLDDGAKYTLSLTVMDDYGQSATTSMDFGVQWSHQAVIPNGTVVMDDLIAKITPTSASGMAQTDTCDIYRLSADLPELIFEGATYGTTYVDPYPAIGGGYRLVCMTANGDYITADSRPAWRDIDSNFEYDRSIIDFDGEQVQLYYNLDLSNSWEKDFQATRYLGGSVKGDWNSGIVRTATLSTVAFTEYNADVINGLRLLAEYAGICHIRTLDGSSFKGDLQVQEDRDHDDYGTKASFSISCTRVDPEELDGMTLADWNEGN